MKIEISKYEKKYQFELEPITQICGYNIPVKTFILESLRRYFSTFKYSEETNYWRDNIKIDGEAVGRRYFSIISMSDMEDVLKSIQWTKKSLMLEYVKNLLQNFECQTQLQAINEELEIIFNKMNLDISQLGELQLSYEINDVWDMVQNSHIVSSNGVAFDEKSNYELLLIFINLIEEVLKISPQKTLIILENIDHFITKDEYAEMITLFQQLIMHNDIYVIVTTSLDQYVAVSKELSKGIVVFGDVSFQMPEEEKMCKFIRENYPCHRDFSDSKINQLITDVVQRIGRQQFLYNIECNVICKLINQSLLIDEKWESSDNLLEIAFLKNGKML